MAGRTRRGGPLGFNGPGIPPISLFKIARSAKRLREGDVAGHERWVCGVEHPLAKFDGQAMLLRGVVQHAEADIRPAEGFAQDEFLGRLSHEVRSDPGRHAVEQVVKRLVPTEPLRSHRPQDAAQQKVVHRPQPPRVALGGFAGPAGLLGDFAGRGGGGSRLVSLLLRLQLRLDRLIALPTGFGRHPQRLHQFP